MLLKHLPTYRYCQKIIITYIGFSHKYKSSSVEVQHGMQCKLEWHAEELNDFCVRCVFWGPIPIEIQSVKQKGEPPNYLKKAP